MLLKSDAMKKVVHAVKELNTALRKLYANREYDFLKREIVIKIDRKTFESLMKTMELLEDTLIDLI